MSAECGVGGPGEMPNAECRMPNAEWENDRC